MPHAVSLHTRALAVSMLAAAVSLAPRAKGEEAQPLPEAPAATTPEPAPEATAEAEAESASALQSLESKLDSLAMDELHRSSAPHLDLYGFADFRWTKNLTPSGSIWRAYNPYSSFSVGNVNLYLASTIAPTLSSLIEVRFLYLPNGATSTNEVEAGRRTRTNTVVSDPADLERPLTYGSIEIERATLDWLPFSYFTLQAGQWLTPYGIWNIDHGSPTIIPVRRPFVIGEALFPERQTGLHVSGELRDASWTVDYHATVSNGRGTFEATQDFDENKGLGGRLALRYAGFSDADIKFGVSGYLGRFTATDPVLELSIRDGLVQLRGDERIRHQYDETSVAADVKLTLGKLLLQGEAVLNDQVYVEGYRRLTDGMLDADARRIGTYGLIGYRTPWWGLMPYSLVEFMNFADSTGLPAALSTTFGLNFRPEASLVLKAQYSAAQLGNSRSEEPLRGPFRLLETQAAWAF